jgi:hypothetical protein
LPAVELQQASEGNIGALVWDSKDGTRRCVGVRDARNELGRFVVPDDDRDCDSVPADKECLELVHDAVVGMVNRDEPQCTTSGPNGLAQSCLLGGRICNEPQGLRGECKATDYCVPDAFCSKCMGGLDQSCVNEALLSATRVECTLFVEPDPNDASIRVPCRQVEPGVIDLTPSNVFLRPCAANNPPAFSRFELPLAFGPMLQVQHSSGMGNTEVAIAVTNSMDTTCKVGVSIEGKVSPDDPTMDAPAPVGLVRWAVPSATGGTGTLHVLLPLWVGFSESCPGAAAACRLAPDGGGAADGVFQCSQQ